MKQTIEANLLKDIREEYERIFTRKDDIDYYMKQIGGAVRLDDGNWIVFEKPSIETSFCFGHGLNGISTEDDYKRAESNCEAVKEKDNFIRYNLDDFCNRHFFDTGLYTLPHYSKSEKFRDIITNRMFHFANEMPKPVSENDTKKIRDELNRMKEEFRKRLETYWKRFGNTKLKTWTYLVD